MNRLDASEAALFGVIAICLILTGGIITSPALTVEQRVTGLGAVFGALAFVIWWGRRSRRD